MDSGCNEVSENIYSIYSVERWVHFDVKIRTRFTDSVTIDNNIEVRVTSFSGKLPYSPAPCTPLAPGGGGLVSPTLGCEYSKIDTLVMIL